MYQSSIEKRAINNMKLIALRYAPGAPRHREYGPSSPGEIECAGAVFDKTNSFILEVMAECNKCPAMLVLPSSRSQTNRSIK